MNKFIKTTSSLAKGTLVTILCAMILSSCALLNKGVALPSPTEEIRG